MTGAPRPEPSLLVLTDGEVFEGEAVGAPAAVATGEVVFTTSMTGYTETVTDPSYAGQIVTFTATQIGNYGVTAADAQRDRPAVRGIVVRELSRRSSNWRSEEDLDQYLRRHGVPAIAGVDTRRLTKHLRDSGAMVGAFGTADEATLRAAAAEEPGTDGVDLVAEVTAAETTTVGSGPWKVVAVDYGLKAKIAAHLGEVATVTIVPASTSAEEILAHGAHGVFLSNGPGDPEAVTGAVDTVRGLLDRTPVFGICLGHQILSLALGGRTEKLPFGHHGANHPVRRIADGTVEITAQNHNFVVSDESVPDATVTHVNLNDGTVEGIASTVLPALSVQHHPEAAPGPTDGARAFADFTALLERVHGAP